MKKSIFLSSLFSFFFCLTASATLWRVNNNPGMSANFTTLQAAVNGAVNGDTIYVEPSGNSYGDANIAKKLIIIGNGSFLTQHPGLQYNTQSSPVGTIFFNAGSEHSMISGIQIFGELYLNAANISVRRCRSALNVWYLNNSNLLISQCWTFVIQENFGNQTGLLITNNVVRNYITISTNSAAIIENNVVGWVESNVLLYLNGANCTVRNNILTNSNGGNISGGSNSIFENNISGSGSLPAGNGNQNNVDMSTVFQTWGFSGNNDSEAQLKAGSPAINAGYYGSGDDIGAFSNGTNRPTYVLGLIPAFPTIYGFSIGPNGNTLNVNVSTRSNN